MKKKLLCGILACMMTFSAAMPLAACKQIIPDQGQTDGQNGELPEIQPGTKITDQETKAQLFNALSETQIGGISYSASANLMLSGSEKPTKDQLSCQGFAAVENGVVKADLYASVSGEQSQYLLLFLRGSDVYYATGETESGKEVDFAALKDRLKSKTDPLILTKEELPESLAPAATKPAIVKMIKNLPSVFDGVVTKTEGGYSIEYDAGESIGSLITGVESILESIDLNHLMTLGGLFSQPYFKSTLEKLLHNISAEEFKEAAISFLPEKTARELPDPEQNETAIDYLEKLLRSGTFYQSLTEGNDAWSEWKTFSAVPLEGLISLLKGEEFSFGEEKLVDSFRDYTKDLTSKAVNYLMDLLSLEEGELSEEALNVSFRFDFDEEKKLMGFSTDGLIKGSRTVASQPQPGEGETQPGEGETQPGEGETQPGEGETQPGEGQSETPSNTEGRRMRDEFSVRTAAASGEEKKIDVKGSFKLEAVKASFSELFDLTGSEYYTQDGTKKI